MTDQEMLMSDQEMLDSLQRIWNNCTMNRDRKMYQKMLVIIYNMYYFLYSDLQIDFPISEFEFDLISSGTFDF